MHLSEFSWSSPVFPILKGCCHGNQFCVISKTQTMCDFCNFYTIWKSWVQMIDLEFFFNISRDVAMATNFVSYRTCSLGAEVSQDPLDRFSQSLHHMVGIELQTINPTFFSRYLKGRCYGKNGAKLPTLPYTYRSVIPIRNGITPCICMIK